MKKEEGIRAAVVIEKNGKFLLVQEGHVSVRGLWNWPQGKIEQEESLEEAAIREAKEETGYEIIVCRKLRVVEHPFPDTKEIHVFLGEIIGGELQVPDDEIIQAKWFYPHELEELKHCMPGPWVYTTISSLQK